MENRSVGVTPAGGFQGTHALFREKNVDDVLQISNVFVNVSKGEVAKSQELRKAFGRDDMDAIVKEVCFSSSRMARHPDQ